MRSSLYRVVLSGTVLAGLLMPSVVTAQVRPSFQGMDRDGDGVITRAEWRGSDESFRRYDLNGDGVLSGDEVRAPGQESDIGAAFALVDLNGDGRVTREEWNRAFDQLDQNRDGIVTQQEFWPGTAVKGGGTSARTNPTRAFTAGRDRGLADGRQAGREDRELRNAWDLEGQRELEQADAGYRNDLGPREEYQAGYREGFRRGYAEGFGPRR